MRILILGGTAFVGRAIVEAALDRDHQVTTFTRSSLPPGASSGRVEALFGDRTLPDAYDFAKGREWDVVFDTWFGAPRIVQQSAAKLRPHVTTYSYVSTCSVYEADPLPFDIDENFQTVDADPAAESTNYPADKRGGELAVLASFGPTASFIARPGLIIGPHEWPARLAWWLRRISEGGEVLSPGPQELALQYIDARDLAKWMVRSAEKHAAGIYNALSPRAHCTISQMLELCKATTNSAANFTWVPPEFMLEQGIEPWTEMPIWISPDMYGFYGFDTSKAQAAGLTCRPISETVTDTWTSILSEAQSVLPPGRIPPGVGREKELEVLAKWARRV